VAYEAAEGTSTRGKLRHAPRAFVLSSSRRQETARAAGKLSGGSRASTALKKVPTVKVLGLAAPRKGTYPPSPLRVRNPPAEPYASPSQAVAAAAASAAAESAIASFGYSPTTAGITRGVAAAAASAAVAAVRSFKRPVTMVEVEAAAAAAPAAMGGEGTKRMRLAPPSKATVLPAAPRGTALIVVPTTSYGAGTDYFWEDVVAAARMLQSKKIMPTDLRKTTADGSLLHRVPYSTMLRWLKDDDEVMRERRHRGVKGSPHWVVELDTRRRETQPLAGAANGAGRSGGRARGRDGPRRRQEPAVRRGGGHAAAARHCKGRMSHSMARCRCKVL
jgi:hypothetical protein